MRQTGHQGVSLCATSVLRLQRSIKTACATIIFLRAGFGMPIFANVWAGTFSTKKCDHEPNLSQHTKQSSLNHYQAFYTLDIGDFIQELKKQKVTLSKQDEFELLSLFEDQKSQTAALCQEIEKTDKEIDKMVYELYGLTEEEIKIVEGN